MQEFIYFKYTKNEIILISVLFFYKSYYSLKLIYYNNFIQLNI